MRAWLKKSPGSRLRCYFRQRRPIADGRQDAAERLKRKCHGILFSREQHRSANAQANLATVNVSLQKTMGRCRAGTASTMPATTRPGWRRERVPRRDRGSQPGIRNAGDGMSTLQIKDTALNNIAKLTSGSRRWHRSIVGAHLRCQPRNLNEEFQSVLAEITREATVGGLTSTAASPCS